MLVRLLANLFINPINISLRLLGKLLLNPINIPLRRSAFAARRCPPSKGDVGLAKAIGAGVVFRPHQHPPASLRLRCVPLSPFEGGMAGAQRITRFKYQRASLRDYKRVRYHGS